jgi:FtsP/CotA-like multicopper oxidase with cupredoxin domain
LQSAQDVAGRARVETDAAWAKAKTLAATKTPSQWDVLGIGDDFHTFHVHDHRWRVPGACEDQRTLGPAEILRVRWREDLPGTWLYHCHVEGHMMEGMIGIYRVAR